MAAHAAIAATVVKSRTTWRIAGITLAISLFIGFVTIAPLVAIPLSLVAHGAPVTQSIPQAAPATSGEWSLPLAGGYTKGRGFGYNPVRGCSYCSTNHRGYDMAQGCGSTVHAAGPGTIITAGGYYGFGNTVRIDHGGDLVTLYGHMQWDSLMVTSGQTVTAGTPLGAEGNTGASFGCHVHFGVFLGGAELDPQPFMAERGLALQ